MNDSEDDCENIASNIKVLPSSTVFNEVMTKTLGSISTSSKSSRIKSTPPGGSNKGVPVYTMGGNTISLKDNVHEFTREIHKALSQRVLMSNL